MEEVIMQNACDLGTGLQSRKNPTGILVIGSIMSLEVEMFSSRFELSIHFLLQITVINFYDIIGITKVENARRRARNDRSGLLDMSECAALWIFKLLIT